MERMNFTGILCGLVFMLVAVTGVRSCGKASPRDEMCRGIPLADESKLDEAACAEIKRRLTMQRMNRAIQ